MSNSDQTLDRISFAQLRASLDSLPPDGSQAAPTDKVYDLPAEVRSLDLNAESATAEVIEFEAASPSWPLIKSLHLADVDENPILTDIFENDCSHICQLTLMDNVDDEAVDKMLAAEWSSLQGLELAQCQSLSAECLERLASQGLERFSPPASFSAAAGALPGVPGALPGVPGGLPGVPGGLPGVPGGLPLLEELYLSGNPCGSEGILTLCTTNSLPNLEFLELESVGRLSPQAMAALANHQALPRLQKLHLGACQLDSSVVSAWQEGGLAQRLQVLQVISGEIDSVDAKAFWRTDNWTNLKSLKWRGALTTEAIVAVAECFGDTLKELRLSGVRFDDRGVDALVRSQLLERLVIFEATECEITALQARSLAKAVGPNLFELVVDRHFGEWAAASRLLPVPRARVMAAGTFLTELH